MTTIIPPDPARAILKKNGLMQEPFRLFVTAVAKLSLLQGSGSPEGVVEAEQGREYMDTAGTASSIKYIKRDADIGGDKTKGWILI
jgi:hypothetical protein